MKIHKPSLSFTCALLLVLFAMTSLVNTSFAADVAGLEKELADLDRAILARKKQLDDENAAALQGLVAQERELAAHERKLERHEPRIERAQERLTFVDNSINELSSWYSSLGAIDKGLNNSTYETKMSSYKADQNTARVELRNLDSEKKQILDDIENSKTQIATLKAKTQNTNDTRLASLLKQKE